MKFCEKLAKQRKNNNLSQEQLAEMLSVSRQAVSKWENGSSYPDMDKIISISKILNCTLEDLLDDGVIKHDSQPEEPQKRHSWIHDWFQSFLNFTEKPVGIIDIDSGLNPNIIPAITCPNSCINARHMSSAYIFICLVIKNINKKRKTFKLIFICIILSFLIILALPL